MPLEIIDWLKARFVVLPEKGQLIWKSPPRNHPRLLGKEAGSPRRGHSKIYWIVKKDGTALRRSHLIFAFVHGRLPRLQIDHKNGNSIDDRISNLREATVTQNAWNHKRRKKKTGLPMGVKRIASGRFQARIGVHKTSINLGVFSSAQQAQQKYLAARKEYFGEFA